MKDLIWLGNRDQDGAIYIGKDRGKCWLVINEIGRHLEYPIPDSLYELINRDLEEQVKRASFVRS